MAVKHSKLRVAHNTLFLNPSTNLVAFTVRILPDGALQSVTMINTRVSADGETNILLTQNGGPWTTFNEWMGINNVVCRALLEYIRLVDTSLPNGKIT